VAEAAALGGEDLTLSFEMKLSRARRLTSPVPLGVMLYGHLPLMIFRNCPVRARKGCKGCNGRTLTDRLGNRFPVRCDGEMAELFNHLPLDLADKGEDTRFADFGILYFTNESAAECRRIIRRFGSGEKPAGAFTRGLSYRGVE